MSKILSNVPVLRTNECLVVTGKAAYANGVLISTSGDAALYKAGTILTSSNLAGVFVPVTGATFGGLATDFLAVVAETLTGVDGLATSVPDNQYRINTYMEGSLNKQMVLNANPAITSAGAASFTEALAARGLYLEAVGGSPVRTLA